MAAGAASVAGAAVMGVLKGACPNCGTLIAGRFIKFEKAFGPRRIPVRLHAGG